MNPTRILLVEDDAVDRMACRRALEETLFALEEADTAAAGLQLVREDVPDLVMLDYHLPDMDGMEFLSRITTENPEIPVIMLTGAQDIAIAVEAMRFGARDYLIKDAERDYLKVLPTVIRRVLRENQAHEERREAEAKLRAAEARYRSLVEQIPATAYTAALDAPGNLSYVSPQIERFGFSQEEWLASPEGILNRIHPDDKANVLEAFARCYETGEPLRCEYRLLAGNGEERWVLDEARIVRNAEHEPLFLQGVLIDITEDKLREKELEYHRRHLEQLVRERTAQIEKQSELLRDANSNLVRGIEERMAVQAQLQKSEARFRLLLESAGEGIYGLDNEGRCTFANDAALAILGYSLEELVGQQMHNLIHHSYGDGTPYPEEACPICDVFRNSEGGRQVDLFWRKDGSSFSAEYTVHPMQEEGKVIGAVSIFRDVTEKQAIANRLAFQATHDALTGLVNRQEFERRLERVMIEQLGGNGEHVLLYLDLDQFKVVNDTCGHIAGDQLLRQISLQLQERIRSRDTLARLGGDEFGVLLEHCHVEQALRIASDLRDAVQDYRFSWEGMIFSIGVSIGLAPLSDTSGTVAAALSAADSACYAAKEQGRNRVHRHNPDDTLLTLHRSQLKWVPFLTEAIDEDRFRLYQQAILPMHGESRPHFEILLRLLDEHDSLIEPMAFFPAAERYNLMPAIDRWVLREVIARHATQHRHEPVSSRPIFSVNISGSTLCDEGMTDFVRALLDENGVPPNMLCFEIKEAAAIANLEQAARFISVLKEKGCLFALDDFGSSISSFGYIKRLPVDFLKLDGSFVRAIAEDRLMRAMAEAINRAAHVMAIETVAECAENEPIVALLLELGIDHAQGYALGRPKPLCMAS